MLKIAYCDDNTCDREKIGNALSYIEAQCDQKFEITEFSSGKDLLKSVETHYYDVILLDILMEQMDGLITASNLRSTGQDSILIFISNYDKKIRELFQFNTFAFLDKPLEKELLLVEFRKILLTDKNRHKPILAFTCNRAKTYVNFREILMVESSNHQVILTTTHARYVINNKLKNIWESLKESKEFAFPNRTTIINMCFSTMDSKTMFTVTALEKKVSVGRSKKESTMERYLDFIGD